jgi:hypothetical protein
LMGKGGNCGRIHRWGGSVAGGEGEEACHHRNGASRPPSGWGMAYGHHRGGLRPLGLDRVRWREPCPFV